jgi:hypothetical protein
MSLHITLALFVVIRSLFLHPLYRYSYRLTARLKRLARRTLVAAAVALITSAVNMVVLTVMHGQQLGWVCLGSCGTDVIINALALYFVTSSVDEATSQSPADHAATPPSKRHSGTTTLRKPKAAPPPEDAPDPSLSYVSNKGILTNDMTSAIVSQPQRTVHFPGTTRADGSDVSEYEMTYKLDVIDSELQTPSGFRTKNSGPGEEPKHRGRDSYLGVNGLAASAAIVGASKFPKISRLGINQPFRWEKDTPKFGKAFSRYCCRRPRLRNAQLFNSRMRIHRGPCQDRGSFAAVESP